MISKDTIRRTALCYWSTEDDCFIVESPLFDRVAGTGNTEAEARTMFDDMLDGAYSELKAGKVIGYNKVGRPAKEGIQLNCKVKQPTHDLISNLAQALDISQGEVVDVLAFHYFNRTTTAPASESMVAAAIRRVLDERGITSLTAKRSAKKQPVTYRIQAASSARKSAARKSSRKSK